MSGMHLNTTDNARVATRALAPGEALLEAPISDQRAANAIHGENVRKAWALERLANRPDQRGM